MRYLVTGGAGFIGSHLCELLLSLGHQVITIDNFSTSNQNNIRVSLQHKKFTLIEADVSTYAELSTIMNTCDGVFHLAASVGVATIINHPLSSLKNSLLATEVVLQVAATKKIPVLYTSSSEVYGLSTKTSFTETDPVILGSPHKARWLYATEKLLGEHLALAYRKELGLPVIIVRLFNTVGPRQSAEYGMVVPRFITQARANQPLTVYGDGSQQRCFTSVFDVSHALYSLMQSKNALGQIVNVGNDKPVSISQLADEIISLTKSQSTKKYISYQEVHPEFAEMPYRKPNIALAKRIINFQPNRNLRTMLKKTVEYFSLE